jgi:hypothetical protein
LNEPETIARVPWEQFLPALPWRQGQHVALIGPTGCGKTTLLLNLLPKRKYVVLFGTKPRDATLNALVRQGYHKMQKWEPLDADMYPRRILWPNAAQLREARNLQRREFTRALDAIYHEGSWCVAIDELWYVIQSLGLREEIKQYLQQARSLGISLVCATQRPAFVPLEVYDQSEHLFFWRDNDERNLRRLSGISWLSAKAVMQAIAHLPLHDVLYINTRTGSMSITRTPKA